jgi:hypothetical protein
MLNDTGWTINEMLIIVKGVKLYFNNFLVLILHENIFKNEFNYEKFSTLLVSLLSG